MLFWLTLQTPFDQITGSTDSPGNWDSTHGLSRVIGPLVCEPNSYWQEKLWIQDGGPQAKTESYNIMPIMLENYTGYQAWF